MHQGGEGRKLDVCYNVQTVVDSKNHLVTNFDVTNCANDYGNLKPMSEKAMEVMGVKSLTNLADTGFYDSKDINACERSGITCLVAKPSRNGPKKAEGFDHQDFIYNPKKDIYICPCQKELTYRSDRNHISGREYHIYSNTSECRKCEKKAVCTRRYSREVLRLTYQDVLDRVDERTRENKTLYHKRKEIVEHVFGTVKAVWGFRQFLCRSKMKVTAEMALTYMAYNLRRVFKVSMEKGDRLVPSFG